MNREAIRRASGVSRMVVSDLADDLREINKRLAYFCTAVLGRSSIRKNSVTAQRTLNSCEFSNTSEYLPGVPSNFRLSWRLLFQSCKNHPAYAGRSPDCSGYNFGGRCVR
jgi:hypothetical protein